MNENLAQTFHWQASSISDPSVNCLHNCKCRWREVCSSFHEWKHFEWVTSRNWAINIKQCEVVLSIYAHSRIAPEPLQSNKAFRIINKWKSANCGRPFRVRISVLTQPHPETLYRLQSKQTIVQVFNDNEAIATASSFASTNFFSPLRLKSASDWGFAEELRDGQPGLPAADLENLIASFVINVCVALESSPIVLMCRMCHYHVKEKKPKSDDFKSLQKQLKTRRQSRAFSDWKIISILIRDD